MHETLDRPVGEETSASAAREGNRVAVVGDSLSGNAPWQEWLPRDEVISFARPGFTSQDVVAISDEIVAAAPDEIIMLIGTNDIGLRRSVEHTVRTIEGLLVDFRRELPGMRLLLHSILPRGAEHAPAIREANIHLRQFGTVIRACYLDLWPAFAEPDGSLRAELTHDGLHLNEAGYEVWRDELEAGIERMRGLPPMSRPLRIPGGGPLV